ncbi:MAG: hypothetical protein D6709_13090, partial [Chloroflexi bacterium]
LYDDALADGWEDWSWNTNVAREHPYALSGKALAFRHREGYAGLSLRTPVALSRADYEAISFWISGGEDPGVRQLMFFVHGTDEGEESRRFHMDVPSGRWTQVVIPFRLLGYVPAIKRINFQERTGQGQPPVFLDNICFLRDTGGVDLSNMANLMPGDLLVFDESVSNLFENWSWDTTLSFANTQPALGLRSLAVQHQAGYAGLSLRFKEPLSPAQYPGLSFSIHAGDQGPRRLQLFIQQADEGEESTRLAFDVPAGGWHQVSIPFSVFGDVKAIKRINLQDRSGQPQTYYLDNIVLVGRPVELQVPAPPTDAPPAGGGPAAPPTSGQPLLANGFVYADQLAPGWENWSWESEINFDNAKPALGRRSIAVRYTQGYAGLSLRSPVTLNAQDYGTLILWVHGGEQGERPLRLFLQQEDIGGDSRAVLFEAPAGIWTPITVPLSYFGDLTTIKRINLQDASGEKQAPFYVDSVQLVREVLSTPLTAPNVGPQPDGSRVVYRDGYLDTGWENWSWESRVNFRNTQPVLFGSRSIAVRGNATGGLSLRSPVTLTAKDYGGVLLRIFATYDLPRRMQLYLQTTDIGGETPGYVFDVMPNRWQTFTVPLSLLGSPQTLKRINIQDLGELGSPAEYYIDEITLLPPSAEKPPAPPPFLALFSNRLAKGWRDASQGARVSFTEADTARAWYAIAVQLEQPNGALRLQAESPLDAGNFETLSFWVHGGPSGVKGLTVALYPSGDGAPVTAEFDAPADEWREVRVPLEGLADLKALAITAGDGAAGTTFYLDDVRLRRASAAAP